MHSGHHARRHHPTTINLRAFLDKLYVAGCNRDPRQSASNVPAVMSDHEGIRSVPSAVLSLLNVTLTGDDSQVSHALFYNDSPRLTVIRTRRSWNRFWVAY